MRICIVTSIPNGGAGAVAERLALIDGVALSCVVLSKELKRSNPLPLLKRKVVKIARIGPLGALNGLRMRSWFVHSQPQDIREVSKKFELPLIEIERVNSSATIEAMTAHRVDLGIGLGNGYISERVFRTPPEGMINYHGELLPEYPGALSIVWPIYYGRRRTGFTIHKIDKGIDTGDILFRREFDIVFLPTLRETVVATGQVVHPHIPQAISDVVANWRTMNEAAKPQKPKQKFTTPTISQYFRMELNNRRFYRESLVARQSPRADVDRS